MKTFMKYWKTFGMFFLLIILIVLFGVLRPKAFLSQATLLNVLRQSAVIGTLSCGLTMVIITGATDISCGGRVAFITCMCAYMALAHWPVWLVIILGILIGGLTGAFNGLLAEGLHTYVFVISIATNNIWYGLTYIITKSVMITGFGPEIKAISQTNFFGKIPSIVLIWIACVIVAEFVLDKTRFGRHVYALGGNREAARLAGINVVKTNILVHAIGGLFIGMGSVILLSRSMSATASTGSTYAFDCITACVLGGVLLGGGRGRVYQATMGVLVVNVLFNGLTIMGISDFVRQVVTGLVLLLAIAMEVLQRNAKVDISDDTAGGRDAEKKGKKELEKKQATA